MTRTAKDDFIDACLEFDSLMKRLNELRENHFNADPEEINYGHAGSVRFANEQIAEALAHFNGGLASHEIIMVVQEALAIEFKQVRLTEAKEP